ncbi:MAG: hypothetical protein AAGF12_16475 [Myxococcota bacterium]
MTLPARFLVLSALVLVLGGGLATASGQDATGRALLRLMPETLAEYARIQPQGYSNFATSAYRIDERQIATLQIHDVRGAGALAHQRRTCSRWERVGGHRACVVQRENNTALIWVFSDTVQVMLGAHDEETAKRMAADLELAPMVALARSMARPAR